MPAADIPSLVDARDGSFGVGLVVWMFVRVHLQGVEPFWAFVCDIEDGKSLCASDTSPSLSMGTAITSWISSASGGGGGYGYGYGTATAAAAAAAAVADHFDRLDHPRLWPRAIFHIMFRCDSVHCARS
jgi:hypothetical protein